MKKIIFIAAAALIIPSGAISADTSVNAKTGINTESGISAHEGGRVNGRLVSGTNAATSYSDPDPSLTNTDFSAGISLDSLFGEDEEPSTTPVYRSGQYDEVE